jgi:hydroxypyruvate reductase
VQRALEDADIVAPLQAAAAVDVIAAGKASGAMLNAFTAGSSVPLRRILAVGPARPAVLPEGTEWFDGGHPLPNEGSLAAARRACEMAAACGGDDLLVVLLSGGGSALMALPADGITLAEKQLAAKRLMEAGADIYELNTVRKHLSAIKGGQLAAACPGAVLTLAISDVVGDDLSVIASGPTVADDSTYADAEAVLARRGLADALVPVRARLTIGARGEHPETPKTGDPRLRRAVARVIGRQRGAIDGARRAAESLGYHVHVLETPVTGEARVAGAAHLAVIAEAAARLPHPLCVVSAGETTVTVTGRGRGGRNQEFAFAVAEAIDAASTHLRWPVAVASIGTDGIDGPTDAAGAIVDTQTLPRARAAGLTPRAYLDDNDTYTFFDWLGDLVRTGPTSTNVGDLQVVLIA